MKLSIAGRCSTQTPAPLPPLDKRNATRAAGLTLLSRPATLQRRLQWSQQKVQTPFSTMLAIQRRGSDWTKRELLSFPSGALGETVPNSLKPFLLSCAALLKRIRQIARDANEKAK